MKTVYVRQGRFSLEFKTELNSSSWRLLPQDIKDAQSIKRFFEQGKDQRIQGRFDTPSLVFFDNDNRPTVYYHVTRDKRLIANFDPGKQVMLDPDHFRPTGDQIEYLRSRSDEVTIEEGGKMETLAEERDYLLSKAPPETLKGFNEFIKEGMTPESIKDFCSSHARTYHNAGSTVSFDE